MPKFLEKHQLRRGDSTLAVLCERIESTRFVIVDGEIEGTESPGFLDDVSVSSFRTIQTDAGRATLIELEAPLSDIELPWAKRAARPNEVSFGEALETAFAVGYTIAPERIREEETFWLFPTYHIGCCAVLVEKAGGRVIPFGSAFALEDWVWGYRLGLLEEPAADIVISEVIDWPRAIATLNQLRNRRVESESGRKLLSDLPLVLEKFGGWRNILLLRLASDAWVWEVRRASNTP